MTISHLATMLLCVSGLIALSACASMPPELYPGYRWQELGDGIYLHSQQDPLAGPVDGNSVIIVSSAEVVVVDTHINPAVARSVIAKIRSMTDKPVSKVINTHWHDDHTNGNHAYRDAFPDAQFIAHSATLAALRKEWLPMEEQRREAYADADPDELNAKAAAMDDPELAYSYRVYAGYVKALKPELPALELVYPDTVFDDELSFDSGGRRIVLKWLGRGNTEGDIVVWLPDDKLLITGDLLVSPIPFAFDSPMQDWITTLQRVSSFGATRYVPGHGSVQHSDKYADQVIALLQQTIAAVRQAHDDGTSFSGLATTVDLSTPERQFTGDDLDRTFAWRAFYLAPGLKSAWASLGYPLPEN